MASSFIPLDHYRTKFYQREVCSKNFLELSDEQLSILSKKVYRWQELMTDHKVYFSDRMCKLERYQNTLEYLISPLIHHELPTFDERIAFLIMMTDPNLVTFKEFLKFDLISLVDISKIEDRNERALLMKKRNRTISSYEYSVREKIGFFDVKLLKYEEMFFKRFFNEKELITEVEINSQDNLMNEAKLLKDFSSISDKRFSELSIIAQTWLSLVPEQFNSKVAAYSVTNQKRLLGLNSLAEQVALFILLIDSDLNMLSIYEEESKIQHIEERIKEQFGYYNIELLILERKFHDRFCPDKKISFWSKTRKY